MPELPPYSLPCRMRPNQVLQVAQVVEQIPGMNISTSPIVGVESVPVIITVPPDTYMPGVFRKIYDAINPPIPINTEVREGRVLGTSEEPQPLSKPRPNPISLLQRVATAVRASFPPHPRADARTS